ncbi:MAG: hypothetical protein WDW36_000472 [Sanguina aurantia]
MLETDRFHRVRAHRGGRGGGANNNPNVSSSTLIPSTNNTAPTSTTHNPHTSSVGRSSLVDGEPSGPSGTSSGRTAAGVAPASPQAAASPQATAVFNHLSGIKRVSLSVAGVCLQEGKVSELQDGATVIPQAISLLADMAQACEVYLVSQVLDDVSEAAVTGALEAAGLLGHGTRQIKPHRLLFCSSLEGKVAIVRQLETQLHFDGSATTVDDLCRFVQLVHVQHPGDLTKAATSASKTVGSAPSLAAYFGL